MNMKEEHNLAIVILNYKTYQDVFTCVDSIRSTIGDISYKIYIVDNYSPNESVEKLSNAYMNAQDIILIANDKNDGFSAGNNIGFKAAIADGYDTILCSNPDVLYYKDAISIMLNTLYANERCGVVGPKVYKPNGTIQNCNKGILSAATFILRRRGFSIFDWFGLEKKYTYVGYDYSQPLYPAGMVSGCCFMIKSALLKEINYLDENVFLYHEEDILGAKLRRAKYFVMLQPTAEIVHVEGKSTGGTSPFTRYCTFYSGLYYLWKYSNCSKFAFRMASFCVKLLISVYSLKDKNYKQYYKKLKSAIRDIKKTRREV